MIVIRSEQIKAFEQIALKNFEDEMVKHLQQFAPKLFEIRGEDCFRKVIQLGIKRSENYGFTNKGPVRFYIETMVSLGCYFDTDPQYPWAGKILNDNNYIDQVYKAEHLYNKVIDFLDKCMGPDNRYAALALRKISKTNYSSLDIQSTNLSESLLKLFFSFFPEKFEYIGEKLLLILINEGKKNALTVGVESTKGKTVITGLMFIFGHGIIKDPLYPWIHDILVNSHYINKENRVTRLYNKSKIYLSTTSKYLLTY